MLESGRPSTERSTALTAIRLVLGLGRTLRRFLRALPVVFCSGFNDKNIVMVLRCRIVVLAKRGIGVWHVPHGEMIFPGVSKGIAHWECCLARSGSEFLCQIAHRGRVFIDQCHQLN